MGRVGRPMPWKIYDVMSCRLEFVSLALQSGANVRLLCRRFGISPTTGYKWLARYEEGRMESLSDQSRQPHSSPKRTAIPMEELIVQTRGKHPKWGARKLRHYLQNHGYKDLPVVSTITEILRRHGLLDSQAAEQSQRYQRFEREVPNALWQLDFKGHFAVGAQRCHPLCALDDHSRFNVLLAACGDEREQTVQQALIGAFRLYGLPQAVLCDNGSPWGSGGGGEYTRLQVWLLRLGVKVYHGRAHHPQTQGKQERFHRTLKAEVLCRQQWRDFQHLQEELDRWRVVYNHQRPHEALAMEVPGKRYSASLHNYPETLPAVEFDSGVEVRRVDEQGWISYRGQLWKIGSGFSGQSVGLRPTTQDHVMEVVFGFHVIDHIDLRSDQTVDLSIT